MSWFKVDDTLHSHPKARCAGLPAMGLWSLAGSYSMSYKTDGFVPVWFVTGWPSGRKLASALCLAEMWEPAIKNGAAGWQFHDWEHYQPLSAEIEADREKSRDRQKRSREARRNAGQAPDVTPDVTRDETRDSQDPDPTRPDPTPVVGVLRSIDGGHPSPNRHLGDATDRDEIGLGS